MTHLGQRALRYGVVALELTSDAADGVVDEEPPKGRVANHF